MIGEVIGAVGGAVAVVGGKVASRALPALVGFNQTGVAGVAAQAASGYVSAWLANKLKPGLGKLVLIGAFAGIVEGFIKGANIPVVSPALGDYYDHAMGMWLEAGASQPEAARLQGYSGSDGDAWGHGGQGEDVTDSVNLLPG
jgi:hypothetical protein